MNKEKNVYRSVVTEETVRTTTNYCRALAIATTYAEIYTPEELKRLLIGRGVDLTHIDVNLLHYSARKQSIINKNIFDLTGEAPKFTEQKPARIRSLADIREAVAEVERKQGKNRKVSELVSIDFPPHETKVLSTEDKEFIERMHELAKQYNVRIVAPDAQQIGTTDTDRCMSDVLINALKDNPMKKGSFSIIKGRPALGERFCPSPDTQYSLEKILEGGIAPGKLGSPSMRGMTQNPFLFWPMEFLMERKISDFDGDTVDLKAMLLREKKKRLKNKRRRRAAKARKK